MNIFERFIVQITANQAGFVKDCGTNDAIPAARLLVKKHREKDCPLYIALLNLDKAFDRIPQRHLVPLQEQLVPKEPLRWVQLVYHD